jgi:hypothetical protein
MNHVVDDVGNILGGYIKAIFRFDQVGKPA